jgi:hypothetical protein
VASALLTHHLRTIEGHWPQKKAYLAPELHYHVYMGIAIRYDGQEPKLRFETFL